MYNNDLGFDDEPIDMTAPNNSQNFNQNYKRYEDNEKRQDTPVILKITGVFVILAMIAALVFMAHLFSLGNFNVDKQLNAIKFTLIPIYAVFIIDSVFMAVYNKQIAVILFAIILPVFYPIKRSHVTYDRRSLYTLWVVGIFVLGGAVLNNVYPQIHDKILLVKNTADEYPDECNDAVKYLKGREVDSGEMIIEVVRRQFDDYTWDAEKNTDGTYIITVTGDTELKVSGVDLQADQMLKDNTVFTFQVDSDLSNWLVRGFTINGRQSDEYAKTAWNDLCQK